MGHSMTPARRATAVALLAVGLAACSGVPTASTRPSTSGITSAPSSATPSPMPGAGPTPPAASCTPVAAGQGAEGFQPLALTFVSPVEGWVLGTSATIPNSCVLLYQTTDGGATWSQVPAPPASYPAEGCYEPPISCVDQVLFATPQRGFAFGASWGDVYETTDDGQVWSRLDVSGVSAMALVGDVALRLRAAEGGCTSGECQLERSTDGGGTWSSAEQPLLVPEGGDGDLLLQGDGYAYAVGFGNAAGGGPETADLYSSGDFGVIWTHEGDPCAAFPSSGGVLTITEAAGAAPGGVFAVVCLVDRSGQRSEVVMVSADGGASFGSPHPVPAFSQALAERLPNAPTMAILDGGQLPTPPDSLFAVGSASVLAVVTSAGLSVSHDGGLTWSATYSCPVDSDGQGGISFVGFETATTAHLVCSNAVARSSDGGLTWATYTFPS